MKRLTAFVFIMLMLMVGSSWAAIWSVNVSNFQFTPANITVFQGDTVVWTNSQGFHNVRPVCDQNLFGNEPAPAPWTYAYVFSGTPGRYDYICEVHPESMIGSVTVQRRTRWNVTVRNFSFTPANLVVTQGDTVVWSAIEGFHNVHHNGSPSLFGNSAAFAPWTYSFVFNLAPSSYPYVCQVHPSLMQGTVTVIAPPSPPAAPMELVDRVVGDNVVLNWRPVDGADCYRVYRSTNSETPAFPELVGVTSDTTLTDFSVIPTNSKYFYQVVSEGN